MDMHKEVNRKNAETLNYYIRPQTFPVAVKMYETEEQLPENIRRPHRDLGYRISGCQGISMARKYGWSVAMGQDDFFCAGMIILGFVKPGDYFLGKLWLDGGYTDTFESAKKTAETILRFDYGKYQAILFSPLFGADFEPDEVMVYGNPAQMVRLVQGSLYKGGGMLTSISNGVSDCAQSLVRPMESGECQFVLSGIGNRIYAATEKDEMCFSIPHGKMNNVLEGLKQNHVKGLRYPIPTVANYKNSNLATLYSTMFDQAGIPIEER
jgi:uncharacterized protein (DUF169 family)